MKQYGKRFLCLLLVFTMLLGVLPAMSNHAHAAEANAASGNISATTQGTYTHSDHPICGDSSCTNHGNAETYTAWDGTDMDANTSNIQLTAGNWYLTNDVNSDGTYVIEAGTVNLCLNGHNIISSANSAIEVRSGATLNICDCQTEAGVISGNGRHCIYNYGTVNVYGGTVGGTIHGIQNYAGTVNISGGTVRGRYGINNSGVVNISGGTVRGNALTGIYNSDNGTVDVSGGTVSGHYGINNSGVVNISGGTVRGNNLTGIYNEGNGLVTVSGTGTVTGATIGIYNSDNGTVDVSGGTVKGTNSYGIDSYSTVKLSGTPTITGNTAGICLRLIEITIDGALAYAADKAISVEMTTPGTFTSGWSTYMPEVAEANIGNYFISANEGCAVQPDGNGELELVEVAPAHKHHSCGTADCSEDHDCSEISFRPWDGSDMDTSKSGIQLTAGNWYLTDNVNTTATYTIESGTVNLCLNGYSIIKERGNSSLFVVNEGTTLNICDCQTEAGIISGSGNQSIYNYGTVNVYGGTVSGSVFNGIFNYHGTVNIYGGTVGGTSEGIRDEAGAVNVYGGTIEASGNESSAGIYTYNGTVSVSGGTVSGTCWGICNVGTMNLSGAPTITGGTKDIGLANGKFITIDGELTYAAANAISVEMSTPGTFTSGWSTYMSEVTEANIGNYFISVNEGCTVQPDGNGELKLAEPHTCGNGIMVTGQAATCTVDGWKDYYKCSCDKLYTTIDCTTEITNLDTWKTGDGKIAAGHNWSYSAAGATITAACESECGVADATLTIYAPELTVFGGLESGQATLSAESIVGVDTLPDIYYEGTGTTSYASSTTAPTDAGTYKVSITINGATASVEYTINKADITPVVSIEGWTYGGTANSPTVSGNSGNGEVTYTYTEKDSEDFSETVPTAVGEYTVKATVAETDNYNGGEATADFTIRRVSAPVTPTPTPPTPEVPVDPDCQQDSSCPISNFTDANPKAWYHDGVHYCLDKGIMEGYPGNLFGTDINTTRAQVLTMLWRLEGQPEADHSITFADVAEGSYYYDAVCWSAETGLVEGYNDEVFGPNDEITREQLMTIMWRYAQSKGVDVSVAEDANLSDYEDSGMVSSWAVDAVTWSCAKGVVNGMTETTLAPKSFAARAQIANLFYRYCKNVLA